MNTNPTDNAELSQSKDQSMSIQAEEKKIEDVVSQARS